MLAQRKDYRKGKQGAGRNQENQGNINGKKGNAKSKNMDGKEVGMSSRYNALYGLENEEAIDQKSPQKKPHPLGRREPILRKNNRNPKRGKHMNYYQTSIYQM